jgi:hypothetical protein
MDAPGTTGTREDENRAKERGFLLRFDQFTVRGRKRVFSCAAGLRGRSRRRQGTHCEGYCKAMLSAPWTALSPALGDGHTHEAHAMREARGGFVLAEWTRRAGVRILFLWTWRRRRAIGGCGSVTWPRMT